MISSERVSVMEMEPSGQTLKRRVRSWEEHEASGVRTLGDSPGAGVSMAVGEGASVGGGSSGAPERAPKASVGGVWGSVLVKARRRRSVSKAQRAMLLGSMDRRQSGVRVRVSQTEMEPQSTKAAREASGESAVAVGAVWSVGVVARGVEMASGQVMSWPLRVAAEKRGAGSAS